MVKNHALKNTARARKAATGETLPEAMRKSDTTSGSKSLVHLGLGVQFDLNGDIPHLFISGNPKHGKTTLAKHILSELRESGLNITVFANFPGEYAGEFPGVAMVDAGGRAESTELLLDALASAARGGYRNTSPKLLVIDSLEVLSEDALINLQILARAGKESGVSLIIVSQRAPEGILKSNTHHVVAGKNSLYVLDDKEFFSIGASARSVPSHEIKIGDTASWDLETGHMMIIGRPGIGKTELAKQVAREAIFSGKSVTVMASKYNAASWKDTFGEAIPVHSDLSSEVIDDLTERSLGKDANKNILIVDGLLIEDRSERTLSEKIIESAYINALRSKSFRVLSISSKADEMEFFFGNVVTLADNLPKDTGTVKSLTYNQILGEDKRNRADDEEKFHRVDQGVGWMIGRGRDVYVQFSFTV